MLPFYFVSSSLSGCFLFTLIKLLSHSRCHQIDSIYSIILLFYVLKRDKGSVVNCREQSIAGVVNFKLMTPFFNRNGSHLINLEKITLKLFSRRKLKLASSINHLSLLHLPKIPVYCKMIIIITRMVRIEHG